VSGWAGESKCLTSAAGCRVPGCIIQSAGAACPDVTLIDYKTGEEKSLAELVGNGKPTVIDFYTSW